MFPLPYLSLFSTSLFMSTLMAISANQWLFIWMSLELNLLSFIPLLTMTKQFQETEGAIKYFLAQALGSGLILLALSLSLNPMETSLSSSTMFASLTIGILMKIGVPPCHFWFPSVMASLSWPLCLILATWQKLIPMTILIFSLHSYFLPPMVFFLAAVSALVGGIGGINQTQLRPLLAYSSITHMGWIIPLALLSSTAASIYLSSYIVISSTIILIFNSKILNSVKFTSNLLMFNIPFSLVIMLLLLSLGGLPPLFGFFPKWIALMTFSQNHQILLAFTLISGSLLSLYYYLTLAFSVTLSSNPSISRLNLVKTPSFLFLVTLSTLSLPLAPTMWAFL